MQITNNEKIVLLYFACVLLIGNSILFLKAQNPASLPELFPQQASIDTPLIEEPLQEHSIDITVATDSLLQKLPGIGPALAQRIIAFRNQYGIHQLEDLKKISGIGIKKFDKIKNYLYIGEVVLPETLQVSDISVPAVPAKPLVVCINTASEAELCQLPGIGPTKAKRIIAFREIHGPFSSLDELVKVPGIGPKTLNRMQPYLLLKDDK